MQPHSMCAVALATIIWHPHRSKQIKRCEMRVRFMKGGNEEQKVYTVDAVHFTHTGFECNLMRSHGGIDCTISGRRMSTLEGSQVFMTHSQQHVADLMEEFRLYKEYITDGKHHRSKKYGRFDGRVAHPDGERLELNCEVKRADGSFVYVPYELEIDRIETM